MEIAIVAWLGNRSHMIVPHVSWGIGIHECDLLAFSRNGYATEIEIKISVSDLRADRKKEHEHRHALIKYLYFAITEEMRERVDMVTDFPLHAGVIVVNDDGYCHIIREPKAQPAQPFSDKMRYELARNCTIKLWAYRQGWVNEQEMDKSYRASHYCIPKERELYVYDRPMYYAVNRYNRITRTYEKDDVSEWEWGGA